MMKTEELIGDALNKAVAQCLGWEINEGCTAPPYSTNWSQGGPIIEREKIELRYHNVIVAGIWYRDSIGKDNCLHKATGPTPLVAAMRCYVASRLGDEVEIPDELQLIATNKG